MRRSDVPRGLMALFGTMRIWKHLDYSVYNDKQRTESSLTDPEAEVVSSEIVLSDGTSQPTPYHRIALDLDVPAWLVPSSNPSHSHLYIDAFVPWEKVVKLLEALEDCGVLEPGYVKASKQRKATFLRLPWVLKGRERVSAVTSTPEGVEAFLAEPEDEVVIPDIQSIF